MSIASHEEDHSAAASSDRAAWIWLGIAALVVIATVFGFLHAGRAFWQVGLIANVGGFLQV